MNPGTIRHSRQAIRKTDAVRAASKRLPINPDRKLNERLDYFCGDFAEAYRIGAEEAQREIVARLNALPVREGD